MPYRQILFAADLTDADLQVGRRVTELAQLYGAEVALLHVVELMPIDTAGEVMIAPDLELEQRQVEHAEQALPKLATSIGLEGCRCQVTVGATAREIVTLAESLNSDLIVVGSHGRHGLALLLGSTANAVLHHTPCDLLAVRLKD